jgi:drug/metabolite transporter (DMT)-like permease
MLLGLLCALFAAACHGVASAMQAVSAREMHEDRRGIDPMLLIRLLRQWRFLASFGLNIVGLVAQVVAVRLLPLFLAQAALSSSIVITALLAVRWFGVRLARTEWTAVAAVCFGLAMLGLSAAGKGSGHASPSFRLALLIATLALGVLGMAAGQLPEPSRNATLGLISGLEFGAFGLALRLLPKLTRVSLPGLLTHPTIYAVIASGILASWFYTSALQRGAVVTATAMMLIGETIPPSVIGVLALGDHARHGWTPVAVVGFFIAVAGALALARFGEVTEPPPTPPPTSADQERSTQAFASSS